MIIGCCLLVILKVKVDVWVFWDFFLMVGEFVFMIIEVCLLDRWVKFIVRLLVCWDFILLVVKVVFKWFFKLWLLLWNCVNFLLEWCKVCKVGVICLIVIWCGVVSGWFVFVKVVFVQVSNVKILSNFFGLCDGILFLVLICVWYLWFNVFIVGFICLFMFLSVRLV